MDHESVYRSIVCLLDRDLFVEHKVQANNYTAIYFFNQRAARIYLGKKIKRIEFYSPYDEDLINVFELSVDFDYSSISDIVNSIWKSCANNAPVAMFGCCHLFVECSDEKRCLQEENIEFWGCYYKRNLENGRIIYGKNKNV